MIKKLTDLWARAKTRDRPAESDGPPLIRRAFLKTFIRCPICDQDFLNHNFTLLSVIPASKGEAVTDLVNKLKNHQWAAAREIREFEPSHDAIVIYVLRCPGSRLAVVTMEDPFELFHNPSIIDYEVLDHAQSQALRTVLAETHWWSIK